MDEKTRRIMRPPVARLFPIGHILSISTGFLLCDMQDVEDILNFLTKDQLWTHQLPRASRDARPWLIESLPWLDGVTCAEVTIQNYCERLAFYADFYGPEHWLSPIPFAHELHRNPFDEITEAITQRRKPLK